MNNRTLQSTVFGASLALATVARAGTTFVETFDGTNVGGWHFGYFEVDEMAMSETGGNPGGYLLTPEVFVTSRPVLSTDLGTASPFTGDYLARDVSAIGVDLISDLDVFEEAPTRVVWLRLTTDNGTPEDPGDDWGFAFVSDQEMPGAGDGWISYDFAIDADAASVPEGWEPFGLTGTWTDLMNDVDRVELVGGGARFISNNWILGVDNARITYCPDLNDDGDVGFADLMVLLGSWGPCDGCGADFNYDGDVGFADLMVLLAAWGPCS